MSLSLGPGDDGLNWFSLGAFSSVTATLVTNLFVTSTDDSGVGSLRQAITTANASGGGTILFASIFGTITLTNGELLITTNMNIVGPGAIVLAVSGNFASRVFNVRSEEHTSELQSLRH